MTALDRTDRALLDFLCSVEAKRHCIVRSVKTRLRPSLRRLRYAGLVWFDSYTPSASAMADWRARNPSQPSPGGAAGEEQPTPKAADDDGGTAARLERAVPPKRNTRWASGDEGRGCTPEPAVGLSNGPIPERKSRTPDTAASTFPCGHPRTPDNIKIEGKRYQRCRQCTNARQRELMRKKRAQAEPKVRQPRSPSAAEIRGQRIAAGVRRSTTAKAMERIEQGLDPRGAKQASVRHAQFALEEKLAMDARLADPIEQAKQTLRKRYTPVVSMAVYGGREDLFVVGSRQNVTQTELLAMAGRLAA